MIRHKPRYRYVRRVDYVSGACLMLPAGLARQLGGFSEEFLPCYFEDSDLCLRVQARRLLRLRQPCLDYHSPPVENHRGIRFRLQAAKHLGQSRHASAEVAGTLRRGVHIPEDWWRAAEDVLGALPEGPVGLSGQMHGLVVLDAEQRVLRPAILWNDQRTAAECAEIEERVGLARLSS